MSGEWGVNGMKLNDHWDKIDCEQKKTQPTIYTYWLVVSIPLKNMSSSVGIMTFPI